MNRNERRKKTMIEKYGPDYAQQFGKRAKATMLERYGEDYFVRIGREGGKNADPAKRSFSKDRDLASRAGKIGGIKCAEKRWAWKIK